MDGPYRVLLTRADNASLRRPLVAAGLAVVEVPLVSIVPTGVALPEPGPLDWVVYTSVQGVRFGHGMARSAGRLAAVGPKTAAALQACVRAPDLVPASAHGKALAQALGERVRGARVWLPRALVVPPDLDRDLRDLGADPVGVAVYRTVCPVDAGLALRNAMPVEGVAFASGSAARHYCLSGGPVSGLQFFVIGPTTAAVCADLGLRISAVADPHDAGGLVQAILSVSGSRDG
jgi:uroporphyrinogen-III synthase